jgi:hypothetical protein
MRVGRRHVLHASVVIAVLVQLGFASAFLADASQTNRSYDALVAHRVPVTAHILGCASLGTTSRSLRNPARICRVSYSYQGASFTAFLPYGQPTTFFVDPNDTGMRMSEVSFDKGPEETTGDIVIAGLLFFGALSVTVVHLLHLRRRKTARQAR